MFSSKNSNRQLIGPISGQLNVESKHGTVVKPIVNENQTVPD
jgi:hypothetical protein